MPGSYNRVIFVGNLTRDPETRFIQTGSQVTKFTLAVNRKTKNGDETTYIDIIAWEKLAEICAKYIKKGSSVLVEGRLVIRGYTDKDGVKRKATEVVIDLMQMLDRKTDDQEGDRYTGGSDSQGSQDNSWRNNANDNSQGNQHEEDPDEIPF